MVGKKEVDSGNDIYGNPIKRIQYEIKQIKVRDKNDRCYSNLTYTENVLQWIKQQFVVLYQMFKGPDHHIDVIFTAPSSAVCGVTNLDTNGKKEYLISGKRL